MVIELDPGSTPSFKLRHTKSALFFDNEVDLEILGPFSCVLGYDSHQAVVLKVSR
jgi:hypothetical protein